MREGKLSFQIAVDVEHCFDYDSNSMMHKYYNLDLKLIDKFNML